MEEQGTFISSKYKKLNDKFSLIVETEEEFNKLKLKKNNYFMYIHCNGCFRKCPLSNAYCRRGKNTKIKFEEEK